MIGIGDRTEETATYDVYIYFVLSWLRSCFDAENEMS
jgi:hypothetical protein